MNETTPTGYTLQMSVNYRQVPGALFCRGTAPQGLAFKVPKLQAQKEVLKKLLLVDGVSLLDKPYIYILLGVNSQLEEEAYIGRTQSIRDRLDYHSFSQHSRWTNWEYVIIFCPDGGTLGIGEFIDIESQLIKDAKKARRFDVRNRQSPDPRSSETFGVGIATFVQITKMLCSALGYRLFEPADQSRQNMSNDLPIFTTPAQAKFKAKGKMTGDGNLFMVLAGSTISPTITRSITPIAKAERKNLQASGVIKNLKFKRNHVFRSASVAAAVVSGKNANANNVWVNLKAFRDGTADEE